MSNMMNKLFGSHHSSASTSDSATTGSMSGNNKTTMGSTYDQAKLQGKNAMNAAIDSKFTTGTASATTGSTSYGAANTGYNTSMSSSAYDSSNTGYGASGASQTSYGSSHTTGSNAAYDSSLSGNNANYGASTMSTAQTGYGKSTMSGQSSHDDAMTRSEERLYVGKETVEAGKAGMKKYVTTEHVATNVPVQKERVVVEREPITEANMDAALSGPDFKESEYEVHLREERAVATKKAVPIERVRMSKVAEQQEQYVEADLRKEHIQVNDATGTVQEKTIGAAPGTTESYQQTRQTRQSRA